MKHSALYIERAALEHPNGEALRRRFAGKPVIPIESHHEIFVRGRQDFQAQKRSSALIAALARPPFVHAAPTRVCGIADVPVYYTEQVRNCVYNCDYCFLQGMHASGHTLVFVNSDAVHAAARELASQTPIWLSISYLTDILAFESTLPLAGEWLDTAAEAPDLTIEIRTKGEASTLLRREPLPNVVLIWTLSPPEIARRHERGCAGFHNRLIAAAAAAERGWRLRIAVDPVLCVPGWTASYPKMIAEAARRLPHRAVEAATYGVFRMGRDHFRRLASARADSRVIHSPFERGRSVVTYDDETIGRTHRFVGDELRGWLGNERVTFVHG